MSALQIHNTPELKQPIMIAAFAGWSDAGGAATGAAQYLIDRWHATRFADFDAEEFYDFTQLRPTVRWEGDERRIDWPENVFYFHHAGERDFIIFNGIEPHLHWRDYSETMLDAVKQFNVGLVLNLGAMFVDYPHTRPLRVTGQAPDEEMAQRAGLSARGGRYEGPTGINGVLNVAYRERDIRTGTIWANVPHYVSASPNPPASLALLKSLMAMLEMEIPLGRMVRASAAFDQQLNEATSRNTEVSDYVRSLEERIDNEGEDAFDYDDDDDGPDEDGELPEPDSIVQDIEDFLRRGPNQD
jgi:proteasome assembly chaperone (PAC2) family protein